MDDCQQAHLHAVLEKHVELFVRSANDLGWTDIVKYVIATGDAHLIKQQPRGSPMTFSAEEEPLIEKQLNARVIQESSSFWASSLVYVCKKNGPVRLCVDYRHLNDVTVKDACPPPQDMALSRFT